MAMSSPNSRPMSGRGITLGCLIWLIVMSVPALALYLVANNEIAWRRGPLNLEVDKLFLINEPAYSGLGFESARPSSTQADGACITTSVSYLLWRNAEGTDQNTSYCQCFDAQGGPIGTCP